MKPIISVALLCLIMSTSLPSSAQDNAAEALPPLHTIWDYDDPAGTRERFDAICPEAEASGNKEYYLSLLTQIARTHGLEGQFDTAHALLDSVETQLSDNLPVATVNYLLERGRTFRSGGEVDKSVSLFERAYALADSTGQDYLAVDAAHMAALAVDNPDERMRWNQRGIKLAQRSDDPRTVNWLGSINNNIGWDYHDRGEYDSALAAFERALEAHQKQGDLQRLQVARWCVARCLRSLDRVNEALTIQMALLKEHQQQGTSDGYVFEELGELHLMKNDSTMAAGFFKEAYSQLSQVRWMMENESKRLARIKRQAGLE